MSVSSEQTVLSRLPQAATLALVWLGVAALGALAFFWDGLIYLGTAWARPEYSYGPMVPLVTAYLTLRELHHRPAQRDDGSRLPGMAIVLTGMVIGMVGNVAQIPTIITYGFILMIGGMVLTVAGTREGFRFWPGWLHLIFMLPLPGFIYNHVSTNLQLISSNIGVTFIEWMQVPVYLDGNIIDLGVYKLQVAEACSGLAYLFPMFSFGWMVAVLYNGPNWHRVVLFLSVIPITIAMNSFRIGVIGFLVAHYGIAQAEGFLHFFEGWIIFIACTLILYAEASILQRFFARKKYEHVLGVDVDGILSPLKKMGGAIARPALIAVSLIVLVAGIAWQLTPRPSAAAEIDRLAFATFPMRIADMEGRTSVLDPQIERILGADDYLVADYSGGSAPVSLLLTFYNSQTQGGGIHSPEVCLPAGGWEVAGWRQQTVAVNGQSVPVNRALIQKGLSRALVYYWFEARGWRTASDYKAKFLSLKDRIAFGRSDGGLVRLITPLGQGESEAAGEARLKAFMSEMLPVLPGYFPGVGSS